MRRNIGFTLIELSIVLVIVALIVSGILVGRDMIANAQTRKLLTQFEQIESAVNTFRGKYSCLPGDCAKASSFGLGTSGNGDDVIGNSCATTEYGGSSGCTGTSAATANLAIYSSGYNLSQGAEQPLFWVHMANAGLMSQTFREINGGDDNTTITNDIAQLAPKAASGRTYLIPFPYAGRTYIRTGFVGSRNANQPMFYGEGALGSIQTASFLGKIGSADIEDVIVPNKKAYSNAVYISAASGNELFISTNPATWNLAGYDTPRWCYTTVVMPIRFATDGECNIVWRLN